MKTKRNTAGQFLPGTHWREPQDFRDRDWLVAEYVVKKRSLGDIAKQFGVSEPAIRFWMKRHDIPRRTTSEARKVKHWGAVGSDNPMWNKKGELNPMWKGGVTPERQAFYASAEWRSACRAVYARDRGFCRRCTLHRDEIPDIPFHIHHLVSFADRDLRADPDNLVTLCEPCHQFVHSKRNVNRDFL